MVDWLWRELGRQLRCPTGVVGSLVGWLMALVNDGPNRLATEALSLRRHDKVLELGFGPGRALKALAAGASGGQVRGVDQSARMVEQAIRRNRAAVTSGRMELVRGPFNALPWADDTFDKVLLVNVVYFFDTQGRDMSEVYRVLRSGGRAVAYATDRSSMDKWPFSLPDTHRTFNALELRTLLESAGFESSGVKVEPLRLPFGIGGLLAVAQKGLSGT